MKKYTYFLLMACLLIACDRNEILSDKENISNEISTRTPSGQKIVLSYVKEENKSEVSFFWWHIINLTGSTLEYRHSGSYEWETYCALAEANHTNINYPDIPYEAGRYEGLSWDNFLIKSNKLSQGKTYEFRIKAVAGYDGGGVKGGETLHSQPYSLHIKSYASWDVSNGNNVALNILLHNESYKKGDVKFTVTIDNSVHSESVHFDGFSSYEPFSSSYKSNSRNGNISIRMQYDITPCWAANYGYNDEDRDFNFQLDVNEQDFFL